MATSLERKGIIAGAVFIILIILLLNYYIFKDKFTEVITIVTLAYVVYFAVSGILEEFSGFGIKLRLRKHTISPKGEVILPGKIIQDNWEQFLTEKGTEQHLRDEILPKMKKMKYTTLTIANGVRIERYVLVNYLIALLAYPFFKHVIFVDSEKFNGHIFADTLLRMLQVPEYRTQSEQGDPTRDKSESIVRLINDWQLEDIPGIVIKNVKVGDSYYETLNKMTEIKSDYIPVVDKLERFTGIVTSKDILNELKKSI